MVEGADRMDGMDDEDRGRGADGGTSLKTGRFVRGLFMRRKVVWQGFPGAFRRVESGAGGPVFDLLVVYDEVGFGEEGGETVGDAEVGGGTAAVVRAAGTPEVKFGAGGFKAADVFDDFGHRGADAVDGADEGVLDVNVNDHAMVSAAADAALKCWWRNSVG